MISLRKQVAFCTLGTVFEWYDFSLFVYLTPIISQLFFPHTNRFSAMLATLGIFATGYLIRPIGAIFFGHLGDRLGRKSTLLVTIFLMAFATTGIGLIPTGTMISTALLIFCRLIQGFATSGEYPGSLTLLAEQYHTRHKCFITSIGICATGIGVFMGALVYAIHLKVLGFGNLLHWGWRIPFLLGAPIGLLGYFLRRSVLESTEFENTRQQGLLSKRAPLISLFQHHTKKFILILFLFILPNILVYVNLAYLGNYALTEHKINADNLMYLNLIITFIYSVTILFFGFLSDYINKKALLITACILMVCFTYPLIKIALQGVLVEQILAQSVIALLLGMLLGPLATVAAESFPVSVRYTGLSLALNLSASFFGGTAPVICTWLAQKTGTPISAAFYIISFAILAMLCSFIVEKRRKAK